MDSTERWQPAAFEEELMCRRVDQVTDVKELQQVAKDLIKHNFNLRKVFKELLYSTLHEDCDGQG